jgi:hypothetical protein
MVKTGEWLALIGETLRFLATPPDASILPGKDSAPTVYPRPASSE